MPPIISTAISFAEYDADTRELHITFKGGRIYTYYSVPSHEYDAFIDAPSQGEHFNKYIKDVYSIR